MQEELVICIPGKWESRADFISAVIASTKGDFMFAGGILAHPEGNDHVELDFCDADKDIWTAFEYGGQGKVSEETLKEIGRHKSAVYLLFPFDIVSQKERIAKFTKVISRSGGLAVKVETSGNAHEWKEWFDLIESDNPFDQYRASIVLVADENYYLSCGMHNFKLPDSQISNRFDPAEAADMINRFNFWQIIENTNVESGHTFSLTADSPHFRLNLLTDNRHSPDSLFYNPNGVWDLTAI